MFPYYLLVAFPFLVSVIQFQSRAKQITEKSKNFPVLLFFFLYFLLLVLRDYTVGGDTITYQRLFQNISNTSWEDIGNFNTEVGYVFLNKFVSWIGGDFRSFLVISSAIMVAPLMKLYYDFSENSMTTIALYLAIPNFVMYFSGLRQSIAISIGVLAFYAMRKKKLLYFLICVLLAVLFHSSAFVLLILWPIYHIKLRPVHLFFLAPVYVVAYVFRGQIFTTILTMMGDDYAHYMEITETRAITMLILFVAFLAYSFVAPAESEMDKDTIGMRNILALVVMIQLFTTINVLVMRVNYYFLVFVPPLIHRITARWIKVDTFFQNLASILIIAFFVIYFLVQVHTTPGLNTYPYVPFWRGNFG